MAECPCGGDDLPEKSDFNPSRDVDQQRLHELDYDLAQEVYRGNEDAATRVFSVIKNYSKVDLARYIAYLHQLVEADDRVNEISFAVFDVMHHGTINDIAPKARDILDSYSETEKATYMCQVVGASLNPAYNAMFQKHRGMMRKKRDGK